MALCIRYRSGEDEVTERVISDLEVEPPNMVHARCHLRGDKRSFVLSRIETAVDLESGEIINNIWQYFGLPSLKPTPATMPAFAERPQPMTTEQAQQQRKADKQALFRPFRHLVIAEHYRTKLWALFDNRCFRCKSPEALELDHHIPQFLGGRLVPGNIVVLCSRCNMVKGERHPSHFYSPDQLAELHGILNSEVGLFDFRFDVTRWCHHPREYLLSLGVSESAAEHALREQDHPFFVGWNAELERPE